MGLKNLRLLNEALLSKLSASVHSAKEGVLLFLRHRFVNEVNMPRVVVSSIWGSIRQSYMAYSKAAFWLLGENSTKSFWHENWLGVVISDFLQVPSSRRKLLQGSVSNFLHEGVWSLSDYFLIAFPHLEAAIQLVPTPFYGSDRVLWRGAMDGILTAKAAYDSLRVVRPELLWCKFIWKHYIPPSRSILCWKLFHIRLPTEDKFIARGMCLTSVCRLCFRHTEFMLHLFLDCTYACTLWTAIKNIFGMLVSRGDGSLVNMFEMNCVIRCSSQLRPLRISAIISVFWFVWYARNSIIFEDVFIPDFVALRCVLKAVKEVGIFRLGHCGQLSI